MTPCACTLKERLRNWRTRSGAFSERKSQRPVKVMSLPRLTGEGDMSRVRKKNLTVPVNSPSDILIQKDEDYARAQRAALALLKRGFTWVGKITFPAMSCTNDTVPAILQALTRLGDRRRIEESKLVVQT